MYEQASDSYPTSPFHPRLRRRRLEIGTVTYWIITIFCDKVSRQDLECIVAHNDHSIRSLASVLVLLDPSAVCTTHNLPLQGLKHSTGIKRTTLSWFVLFNKRVHDEPSVNSQVNSSVPQGSVLGPTASLASLTYKVSVI